MKPKIIPLFLVLVLTGCTTSSSPTGSVNGPEHMMDSNPIAQSHRSYEVEITSDITGLKPNKKTTLSYVIKNDKGEVLKAYETVHEKIMHFITVRQDLTAFQHLHPSFNEATGEFTVDVSFPSDGPYRLFPDFTPGKDNPQELPVTVYQDTQVGNLGNYKAQPVVPDTQAIKQSGDYLVTTTFPNTIEAQTEVTYSLDISQQGKPITDLEPYLGALGHSVILREGTLDFIHTHALETESTGGMGEHSMKPNGSSISTGPNIRFTSTFPESGVYKIFTQFQHQGTVQTAEYSVAVL